MIVVTTPTGRIGSRLTELLLEHGVALRVIARDPSRLEPAVREGAETIVGSHADPAVLDAALTGADAFFLVVPPDPQTDSVDRYYVEYGRRARQAIERAEVGHAVLISTMGGGKDHAGHLSAVRAAETEIGRSGTAVRALAPPFFMENLLRQADSLRNGVLALPNAADRLLPVVATDDLAAAAADLLVDLSWPGLGRIPISSPDALTPTDVATTVGEVIGRDVTYHQVPIDEYGETMRGYGLSPAWAEGIVEMAAAQNAGFYESEIDAGRGVAPTTLAEWCSRVLVP